MFKLQSQMCCLHPGDAALLVVHPPLTLQKILIMVKYSVVLIDTHGHFMCTASKDLIYFSGEKKQLE